jgi:hypothetical protein
MYNLQRFIVPRDQMIRKSGSSHQHMRWIPDPPRGLVHLPFFWKVSASVEGIFPFGLNTGIDQQPQPDFLIKGPVYGYQYP